MARKKVRKRRNNNIYYLHELLGHLNEFSVNLESQTHVCYPLLITNDEIRERLVNRHIYTPTWWRHVPDYFSERDALEKRLAKYMLIIPIDQRYNDDDMKLISDIIHEELGAC